MPYVKVLPNLREAFNRQPSYPAPGRPCLSSDPGRCAWMTAQNQTRGGMMGLGGPSDCGAGQIWDPNFVYGTLPPGQCVTQAQSTANQQANPSQYSGGSGIADSLLQAAVSIFGAKPAAAGVPVVASGMSTTTKVALAGAGVLAFALIMKKSSSS